MDPAVGESQSEKVSHKYSTPDIELNDNRKQPHKASRQMTPTDTESTWIAGRRSFFRSSSEFSPWASARQLSSGGSNREDEKQKMSSKQKSDAIVEEAICPRHDMGSASIEGEFSNIQYGRLRDRPACLITVDFRLVHHIGHIIDGALMSFEFGSGDPTRKDTHSIKEVVSKAFAPLELEGVASHSRKTKKSIVKPNLKALSVQFEGGNIERGMVVDEATKWHVQGRRESSQKNVPYNIISWEIFQNSMTTDSVPRKVRVGMIVFYEEDTPFWTKVKIKGGLRGVVARYKAPTHDTRWFHPPRQPRKETVLTQEMITTLVDQYNSTIPDVAALSTIASLSSVASPTLGKDINITVGQQVPAEGSEGVLDEASENIASILGTASMMDTIEDLAYDDDSLCSRDEGGYAEV